MKLVSSQSFVFLWFIFLRANYISIIEELSIIKKKKKVTMVNAVKRIAIDKILVVEIKKKRSARDQGPGSE